MVTSRVGRPSCRVRSPAGEVSATAWLLSRPVVTAPIVGATKLTHLEDAVASVELELSAEECAELEAGYTPHKVLGH